MSETQQTATEATIKDPKYLKTKPIPVPMPIPWERDEKWLRTFFSTWWQVIRHTEQSLVSTPLPGDLLRPFSYALLVIFAPEIVLIMLTFGVGFFIQPDQALQSSIVFSVAFSDLFIQIVFWTLGFLLSGGVIHLLLKLFRLAKAPLLTTYRNLAYAISAKFLMLPFLAWPILLIFDQEGALFESLVIASFLYGLLITVIAISMICTALDAAHGCGKGKAFLIQLIPIAIYALIR